METVEGRTYRAEPPALVIAALLSRADEMRQRFERVAEALPELSALEKTESNARPHAAVFEGREGIMEIAKRFERNSGEFLELVPYDAFRAFFDQSEFRGHQERLVKNQVHGRVLFVSAEAPVACMRDIWERYGWHSRHIEPSAAPLLGHLSVKGDEVYGFTYAERPVGIVIANRHLAASLRALFELAWKAAPDFIAFPHA